MAAEKHSCTSMKNTIQADVEGGSNSTLRILVATDCHLGFLEKDDLRRFDSFDTFEEICSLAEQHKVDFMLLGGDLFHENKPSHSTLCKTAEILRHYCLNNRTVQFQVVSDQALSLQNRSGRVNYEDPNLNVGLPVFTIHGDHDDPAGVDNLSTIEFLSACNFLNYFGKVDPASSSAGQIAVHPILIRKGATSLALYGLGNIRDGRLSRIFQTPHAIEWIQPENLQDDIPLSDWFNIFVLHQNRIKENLKDGINEHVLPHFLDLVIWGHEHECLIDPQEVPGAGFDIIQPGSSVATSLTNAEAKSKHVLLLEIKGKQYRPTKIPLKSVRPFEYAQFVLEDQVDIDVRDAASIHSHLDKIVTNLIEKTSKTTAGGSELKLPLVRVKVDYSGFLTINPQRFGQKYVGKVANPQDILIFSRSTKRPRSTPENTGGYEELDPNDLNQKTIEALIAENNLSMQILPVSDLNTALHDFVNKDDKMAFHSCFQQNNEQAKLKLTTATEEFNIEEEEEQKIKFELDQLMQAPLKDSCILSMETNQTNETTTPGFLNFPGSTLSAFDELRGSSSEEKDGNESDEIVDTSDVECSQLARQRKKKRPAPPHPSGGGGGAGGSASAGGRRRKTDLASFRQIPAKKDAADEAKNGRPWQVAGRYGAVKTRR